MNIEMKKIALIIALPFVFCGNTVAQVYDTLFWGDREPTFYYWDTNWIDHYADDREPCDTTHWRMGYTLGGEFQEDGQQEVARVCLTDTALKIIGVAGVVRLGSYDPSLPTVDSTILPEYFRLWTYSETEGKMVVRAAARFDTFQPRYVVQTQTYWREGYSSFGNPSVEPYYYCDTTYRGRCFMPIYEGYFDEPVTVYDSFYDSGTQWNNYLVADYTEEEFPIGSGNYIIHAVNVRYEHPNTIYYNAQPYYPGFPPVPPYHYKRYHLVNRINAEQQDTNWVRVATGYDYAVFLWYFPIFDTTGRNIAPPPDTCPVPQNLRVGYLSSENVTLLWSEGSVSSWDVSIAAVGADPDSGMITRCHNAFATFTDLDTGMWYAARVRTVCRNNRTSLWSDSVQFYVPGNAGQGTEAVETPEDSYNMLVPNPASGTVTVMSSFQLQKVEIYSMDGRRLMQQKAGGIAATVDIGALPSGTYFVRIGTNHGTAFKRLVVK